MTLVELAVAAAVLSLVAVALGGLVMAVDTARTHVQGLHEATAQGRFAIERIRDAVNRSGTYRIGSGSTVPGVAVLWNDDRPEVLVVWTGGRETSLADASPLARRPRANELVIYTPDPAAPHELCELVVPSATDEVDFAGSGFESRIRQLISDANAERVPLCDRIRTTSISGTITSTVRFEPEATPSAPQIADTAVGTTDWHALPWAGGISTSSSGLRQILIRIELQLVTLERSGTASGTASESPSLPLFGAAVRRYQHWKG